MNEPSMVDVVRRAIFDEMDRWSVRQRDSDDQVCRYDGFDEDPSVMATFPAGDGEMHMYDMQAEAASRAAIEAVRSFDLVYRQDGQVVHELRGSPNDIWKAILTNALTETPHVG